MSSGFCARNFVTLISFSAKNFVTVVSRNLVTVTSLLYSRNFVTLMSFWRNFVTVVSRKTLVAVARKWGELRVVFSPCSSFD